MYLEVILRNDAAKHLNFMAGIYTLDAEFHEKVFNGSNVLMPVWIGPNGYAMWLKPHIGTVNIGTDNQIFIYRYIGANKCPNEENDEWIAENIQKWI